MSKEPQRIPSAIDMANHYASVFNAGRKYYQITYWGRILEKCHPKHTQPGTNGRKMCMKVLQEALSWHLDNTTNGDERTKITHALKQLNGYTD